MLAIELSTSIDCAREMRGTASIASTVIGRWASASTRSGLSAGAMRPTSVAPSASFRSRRRGRVDLEHDAAAPRLVAGDDGGAASTYASSVNDDCAPAPDSTTTSYPSSINWRRSPESPRRGSRPLGFQRRHRWRFLVPQRKRGLVGAQAVRPLVGDGREVAVEARPQCPDLIG